MKTCKQCGKLLPERNFGLRNFCSTACRIAYRKEYLRQKKKEYRKGSNKGSYYNTYSNTRTIPDGLGQSTDTKIRLNPEDLRIAKQCCNYEMKQVVGYCITLHEPYYGFKTECKDCFIFHCLKQALTRGKHGRIIPRAY
jgi:hypothetical protein